MKPATIRTNIELDAELVAEATRLTGIRTKRLLVREGLQALVDSKRRLRLSDLSGKIEFAPGYDHKALRTTRR
ncbi:MAG: type II toxin-antitoxin system VapB family antitoxin [Deltaproteobacteria bacterium]|nr:type II toxin-antitoxin system VapB family antitoxin [Deltaproteobacteria bacterium]